MIRDFVFAETARTHFDALFQGAEDSRRKGLTEDCPGSRPARGVAEDKHRLTVSYEVHTSAVVITGIGAAPTSPAGLRQPFQDMEMRHEGGGRWIHLNPHEE